jgi:hypothetical protein
VPGTFSGSGARVSRHISKPNYALPARPRPWVPAAGRQTFTLLNTGHPPIQMLGYEHPVEFGASNPFRVGVKRALRERKGTQQLIPPTYHNPTTAFRVRKSYVATPILTDRYVQFPPSPPGRHASNTEKNTGTGRKEPLDEGRPRRILTIADCMPRRSGVC